METIHIGKDRVKVILSAADVTSRKPEIIKDGEDDAGYVIGRVLSEMSDMQELYVSGGSLFVQLFESKDGGCEMYISKLDNGSTVGKDGICKVKYIFGDPRSETLFCRERDVELSGKRKERFIYCFSSFEDLLSVCLEISKADSDGESEAYVSDLGETFYLTLEKDSCHPSEFSAVKCSSAEALYISEHCRKIASDAVNTLKSYAV